WNMPRQKTTLLCQGIKVSSKQAKPIYDICKECSDILVIEPPDIFIIQDPVLNAGTYGDGKNNNFVLLTSGLIDSVSVDELFSVIGHEMGHIKSGHAFYHTVATWIGLYTGACTEILSSLKFGISGVGKIIADYTLTPALLKWSRESEITADRAGLICSQNLETTCRAIAKLHFGSKKLAHMLNIKEVLAQQNEIRDKGLPGEIEQWMKMSHPPISMRIKRLYDFYNSREYKAIFSYRTKRIGKYALGDYYKILKLRPGASTKMIFSAYESLISEIKKRSFKNENQKEILLKKIKGAYNILSNITFRNEYDNLLRKA
ncbi:MAG: hypothetical protein FJ240_13955, partial [Nitrospira sp.]|nr:hypothetical protein [Nitrospira sp.]